MTREQLLAIRDSFAANSKELERKMPEIAQKGEIHLITVSGTIHLLLEALVDACDDAIRVTPEATAAETGKELTNIIQRQAEWIHEFRGLIEEIVYDLPNDNHRDKIRTMLAMDTVR